MANAEGSPQSLPLASTVIAVAGVAMLVILFQRLLTSKKDPREPPYVPTWIGHLAPLLLEGAVYYSKLDRRYHQGLYTLQLPTGKMYMVSNAEWAQAIHKAHKTLSFNVLVYQAMKKVFDMDDRTMDMLKDNMHDEKGDRSGLLLETHDVIARTLAPGKDLDDLNASFLALLTPHFNVLARNSEVEQVKLFWWLRHHFSLASSTSLYGPGNPFVFDPSLEEDFWTMEANTLWYFLLPYPSLAIPRGYRARQRLANAFVEYAEKERYKSSSQLIRNRATCCLGYGMTPKAYGMGEVSMLFGTLVNTVPCSFWLLSWIFADAVLLADIRAEVDACTRSDGRGRIINASELKTQCPLLASALRETMRLVALLNTNRYVREDTVVTNNATGETYLLKKDNMVQIATNVMHLQPDVYGPDSDRFNPRRFVPTVEKVRSLIYGIQPWNMHRNEDAGKPVDPAAAYRDTNGKNHGGSFRPFGGGNNICPGRHFASTEMLAVVSLFVAGFEIQMPGGRQYKPPPMKGLQMLQGVILPKSDVEVCIRRRTGHEDVEWSFEV